MTLDDDAAERFSAQYRSNYSMIAATCARRLGNRQAGEDAAHEVFRIAWQHSSTDVIDVAWLYVTARNVVGNEYRRSSRASAAYVRLEPRQEVAQEESTDEMDVTAAISQLRQADRDLLYMAYWEDLTAREISDILKISAGAVWVRLSRSRDALRRILEATPAESWREQRG
ncbi:RNA polymerase sigma factor [Salinibacterium sp.]|uniref:RNA polymerase sigma factor n=1 Tax=Salinibacterium sp. TaxID=1915057 RepID=UPI0037C8F93A